MNLVAQVTAHHHLRSALLQQKDLPHEGKREKSLRRMSSRLGRNGAIVRPSSASRAPNLVRAAAASRAIDLTEDAPNAATRPLSPNPHARRTDPPLLYVVSAHHHHGFWERHGQGIDLVGIYTTREEATRAARHRYRREESEVDNEWEHRWDQVDGELCLKAKRAGGEDDVETLTVTVSAVRYRSVNDAMKAGHRIGEEAWKEEVRRHLRRGLREELKNNLTEEIEEEMMKRLKKELWEGMDEQLREEVKEELKEEDDELKEEAKEELKEELDEELRDELKEELREEWDDELREELKEELEEEIKEELREELSERQCVYVLTVEHRVEGELQESETADVHLDLKRAEMAVKREYRKCCYDVGAEPDFHADRRCANGLLSYEFVWEGEGEETWNICLEEKMLQ